MVRKGKKIADANINKAWNKACVREKILQSSPDGEVVAHLEAVDGQKQPKYFGPIPHDLRRSYVRSMDNADVPASIGQKITGHLDALVYEDYNNKHREDLKKAVAKREMDQAIKESRRNS